MITKKEFIEKYCERSDMAYKVMLKYKRMAAPCNCDEPMCQGWQMVNVEDASLPGPDCFKPKWWCRPLLWRIRLFIEKVLYHA
jgi:hypothetical protein